MQLSRVRLFSVSLTVCLLGALAENSSAQWSVDSQSMLRENTLPSPPQLTQPQPSSPTHPGDYLLGPGDTLAIIVHGVIGSFGDAPTHYPSASQPNILPASGYPIQVQGDGKLHLPQIEPLFVAGLNVVQSQEIIDAAYLQSGITNKQHMVMLSLLRKRQVRATVVHSSSAGSRAAYVKLDADHATVLEAVAAGGEYDPHATVRVLRPAYADAPWGGLADGSVVELQSAPESFFYTGGLLQGGQFGLPGDRELNALQAIGVAGGFAPPILGPHRLIIIPRGGPALNIPYRQLLNNPNAYPVHPGDQLIVK